MIILLCISNVCSTTVAQLLLKMGALRSRNHERFSAYVLSAYVLFVLTAIGSYFLMQRMEMKYFAGLMSVNYIMTAAASALILGEEMTLRRWVGTLLITIGVAIFVYS